MRLVALQYAIRNREHNVIYGLFNKTIIERLFPENARMLSSELIWRRSVL